MDCCHYSNSFHHPERKNKNRSLESSREKIKDFSVYTCPMHPEIRRTAPGMCPECGMSLVPSHDTKDGQQTDGHDQHQGHSTNAFIWKFWVALVLSVPLVAYSDLPEMFLGWRMPDLPGQDYLILILGSIVFFYAGWVFLASAYREIRAKLPGMMTLIAIAISAAYFWSIYATFADEMTLFWELGTLVAIMLLGHWIEMRSVKGARGALQELAVLLPKNATVIRGGQELSIMVNEIEQGDIVVVRPGEKVPADGVVKDGVSDLDESIVTGESKPVTKQAGDEVIAGTINGDGGLKVEVNKVGDQTFLANVMQLVAEAEASKSRLQVLSDKAALGLTFVAVGVGTVTLVTWLMVGGSVAFAVARLVAVLVIACPHALGLAVPLTASISTNMAARNGFIIKRRLALEAARNVDAVLFDKTGTLTKGEFGVEKILPASGLVDEVLTLAASVNSGSEHSIGRAIVKEAKERELRIDEVSEFERLAGKGAKGRIDGVITYVGSEVLVKDMGLEIEKETSEQIKILEGEGKTVVYVLRESELLGAIALADIIREESRQAIKALHDQGQKVAMITGDSQEVAAWVSRELGIDEYFARVLPEKKVEKVKELQSRGLRVAMVGDGVNDAPALTQADVGIAIGAGTNVAIESAGIILAKNDPLDIPKIIRLSRLTYGKMIQNLFWATGYNVVAMPLAAGAFVFMGVPAIDPAIGAIFMSASTVIVAINAVLLKRRDL